MQQFKLVYGDYFWPELFTRLVISPFFVVGGQELNLSQALRKSIVKKTSKTGDYMTTAEAIRILVITENNSERHVANLVMKFTQPKGQMIHAQLYPKSLNGICSESGYFFAGDNMTLMSKMSELKNMYNQGYLKMVETLTEEAIQAGKDLCNILTNKTVQHNRFSR